MLDCTPKFTYTQYMLSLSQVTFETRTILKWGAISLGFLLSIFLIFKIGGTIKEAIFPTPTPAPKVEFGKLEAINFLAKATNKKLSFSLDTATGNLPNFPTQIKVYKIKKNEPNLLALAKAQDKVGKVGFKKSPAGLSESIYQWIDEDVLGRTLTMNIFSYNFNMFSSFLADPNAETFNTKGFERAKSVAQDFLFSLELFPLDFDTAKTRVNLFSIKNYSLIPATSISSTQAVQISFFQRKFDNRSIYYPGISVSPVAVVIGVVNGEPEVVEANSSYQTPSGEFSTYPIKSSKESFEELKNGKAFIGSSIGSFGKNGKISIKNISLGYYIGEREQTYLMPIIVFEGNDGFYAYVWAVTDEWINK